MVGRKERSLKKPDQGMWVWSEHWEATEGSSKEHQTWPGPYFPRGNLTAQLTKPHSQHKIPIHIAMVPYPHVALPSTLGNREPHGERAWLVTLWLLSSLGSLMCPREDREGMN